jgi:uncharacterized OsmC-like protein
VSHLTVVHEYGDRYDIAIRGHSVVTDQPVSAGGYDEGPTPTELFAASLAGCVAFYVGRFLRRHGRLGEAFEVECDFTMSEGQPARVQAIDLRVVIRADIDAELRDAVDRVARHCTVHNSLVQTPEVSIAIETGALAPV